ncbi:uncharacterized protein LOC106655675 [Trichogramma pretiosum]|uniref:uncharacterized protein LOC106655675 n=1 Tax=Trichogramma pretiosum TaxID=7493 RepID=UPI0006C93F39|nr:uncharacterized protein LOC106655675 [Trichogramma pretiosum]
MVKILINRQTLGAVEETEKWIRQGLYMTQSYLMKQANSVKQSEEFFDKLLKCKSILKLDFERACPYIIKLLSDKSISIDIFNKLGDLTYHIATACGIIEADDIMWFVKNLIYAQQDIVDKFNAVCMAGQDHLIGDFVTDANINVNLRVEGKHELSYPLFLALRYTRWEAVQTLLLHGANPNVTALFDRTPLHKLCYEIRDSYPYFQSATKIVRCLIKAKANVNATDCFGNNPMFCALMRAVYDLYNTNFYLTDFRMRPVAVLALLKILVRTPNFEAGCIKADLAATNRMGQTLIHFILDSDREEINLLPYIEVVRWDEDRVAIIEFLLEQGAPVDAPDLYNDSPLQVAMNNFNYRAVDLLLNCQADLKIVRFQRQTFQRKRSAFGYYKAIVDLLKTIEILESRGYKLNEEEHELVSDFIMTPRKRVVSDLDTFKSSFGSDYFSKIYSYVPGTHISTPDDFNMAVFRTNDYLISIKVEELCESEKVYQRFKNLITRISPLIEGTEDYYSDERDDRFYIETIKLLKREMEKLSFPPYEENTNLFKQQFVFHVDSLNDFLKQILITGTVRKWVGSIMTQKYLKKIEKESSMVTDDMEKIILN